MRLTKLAATLAVTAGMLAALPAGASAATSCLFQSDVATDSNQLKLEDSLLCLTNVYRLRSGVPAMPRDTRLAVAARAHSVDMFNRNFFSHVNPEGAGPLQRAPAAGYPSGAGENIAMNIQGTVLALFEQWRTSTTGHNENMLNPGYKAAGFGVKRGCCPQGPAGIVGTQMFGLVPANTKYTALDLFASSEACARTKLKVISAREKLKKKKGSAKERLKAQIRSGNRRAKRICKSPV